MNEVLLTVRGRALSAEHLATIRELARQPGQTRRGISLSVCERFGWVQANGRLWDQACRDLLLRLHRRGWLELPPPRKRAGRRQPVTWTAASDPGTPIVTPVHELGSLRARCVDGTALARLWNEYVARYHYLGLGLLVGPHLRYLVESETGWVAALGFCAAAWAVRPRDAWIGWTPEQRRAGLRHIVNQARFLILPWVRSKNLASCLLGLSVRWLVRDWEARYRVRPWLLETFVDGQRFAGTCYRAANWLHVGQTQGRGKLDRENRYALPVKEIFLYPLHRRTRQWLRDPPPVAAAACTARPPVSPIPR